jgi:hypothetical protein
MLIIFPIISTIVHYTTALFLIDRVPNICTSQNPSWRCLYTENSYTASVVWGLVGKIMNLCFA